MRVQFPQLQWVVTASGVNAVVDATEPAAGSVVHICVGLIISAINANAASQAFNWTLFDGLSTLASGSVSVAASGNPGSAITVPIMPLLIPGTAGNSMTLELGPAAVSLTYKATLIGFDL